MARGFTLIAVLVVLTASGCGSSEKDKLIAKADPICQQTNARIAAANASLQGANNLSDPQTVQKVAQTGLSLAGEEHKAVAKLTALKAPSSLSKDWKVILLGLQTLANNTAQLAIEAKAKNVQLGEETIRRNREIQKLLIKIAEHDGFKHCGRLN